MAKRIVEIGSTVDRADINPKQILSYRMVASMPAKSGSKRRFQHPLLVASQPEAPDADKFAATPANM